MLDKVLQTECLDATVYKYAHYFDLKFYLFCLRGFKR